MARVRHQRRLVHSGCKSHPGTGSFRQVAIGAAVEVTKLLKPPVEEGRKGDSARCTSPQGAQERRCGCRGQQAGAHRLGRVVERRRVQALSERPGGVS
jgi:hypothetical protein